MSLSASLQYKTSAARDHLYQIALNQKLLHIFEKWCKFSHCVKSKIMQKEVA
jgi:hypothetical protein